LPKECDGARIDDDDDDDKNLLKPQMATMSPLPRPS
jgi:hypothetical protein